ncbi:SRPBCC domain-containing protein [Thalassobaculum sp. OXR-137]|uniref:VOC family protein n=1 Tax=Thalassobaculum sp. OXR-137 TaxID=3100173 RepID=UPI002AC94C91|nr:VOC family protein [Thalassobaculum sp. OXR-137]WPZ36449.1 SRPBCC domain-containing protein [Thalassobaculum sp. OXR-137]
MTVPVQKPDDLTLVIDRVLDAPRSAVWRCWSEPDLMMQWYCPKPWQVTAAEMDLYPGGRFNTVMEGPDGERFDNVGSFLKVEPGRHLTFTDAYTEGFVPSGKHFMTGFLTLEEAEGGRTRMIWGARHSSVETVQQHLEMGFEAGWNAAADQLEALAASLPVPIGADLLFTSKARTCLFLPEGALEAAEFYISLLPDSRIEQVYRPDPNGPPLVVEFTLGGTPYMTMNGCPATTPSHAVSISVLTEDQAETDRLWAALSADGGEGGQCGWIVDRFGIHWQIVPKALPRLMHAADPEAAGRVMEALMGMGKIDVAGLQVAFLGHRAAG